MEKETSMSLQYSDTSSEKNFSAEDKGKMSQVQLSPEEVRILRECNRESFYYRCLPFALTGMAATFVAFQKGMIRGHPKWGPAFKMSGAAFAGWLLGKLSYRTKCEDKFLHVQNSVIGDAIRKKRGYIIERFDSDRNLYSGEADLSLKDDNFASQSSGDFHSSSRSLNFDANVPYSELDDRQRPSLDNENDNLSQSQPVKSFTTYDELRRRNREEYERQQRQPGMSQRPWSSPAPDAPRRTYGEFQDDSTRNVYGDSWDNAKFK